MSDNKSILEVSIGDKDIVHITIGGAITAEDLPKLNDWIQKTKETIKNQYDTKQEKVLCLVNISNLKEYHPEVLTELAKMMKENEPYVLRTATFGGSVYMTMAEDIILAISGRKNLKAFNTHDEAVAWLHEGGEIKETTVEL
jgi:hypothetical protein